ncbi:MAG: hypothetical protein V3V31_00285 [Methylococcales bacterium]
MITDFFKKIESDGLDYVVIKSFDDIELLFQNKSVELDVYIPLSQKEAFRQQAAEFGFSLRKTTVERQTEFFYILDKDRLFMIHVAYQIITGSRFKNCPLNTEQDLLNSTTRLKGIRISDQKPYLYYHTVKFLLLGTEKHRSELKNASVEDLEYVDAKLKKDYGLKPSVTKELREAGFEENARLRLKKAFMLSKPGMLFWLALRHTADRIGSRSRWIIKRRGFDIAFVGIDGSGKSSLSKQVQERLSFLGCKSVIYVGPKYDNKMVSIVMRSLNVVKGRIRRFLGLVSVYDRYLYDILAYRNSLPSWMESLLFFLIPRPDFTFFCTTDFSIIIARKEHDNPEQLKRVNERYKTISNGQNAIYEIDTSRDVEESIHEIISIMTPRINRSLI